MPTPEPDVETGSDTESQDSITIPKSVLGDRQCKPGERLVMTVTDVDPQTGDVEAKLADYGDKAAGGNGGDNSDMDSYPMES